MTTIINPSGNLQQSSSNPKQKSSNRDENYSAFKIYNIKEKDGKLYAGPDGWDGLVKANKSSLKSTDWYQSLDENSLPKTLKSEDLTSTFEKIKHKPDQQQTFLNRLKVTCDKALNEGRLYSSDTPKPCGGGLPGCVYNDAKVIKLDDNSFLNIKESSPDMIENTNTDFKTLVINHIKDNQYKNHFATIVDLKAKKFEIIDQNRYFRFLKPNHANNASFLNTCASVALEERTRSN